MHGVFGLRGRLSDKSDQTEIIHMKNIAVLVSGNGTNLQKIMDAVKSGALKACLTLVISDQEKAFALKRARKAGVRNILLDPKEFLTREDFERKLVELLKREKIDLVVLAGFMRILSPYFVKQFKNRIVNIHPALLPAFKGARAIKDAWQYGVRVTGVTVHLVDEKVDHGPIVAQEALEIREGESVEVLERKIHKLEHRIYPAAIRRLLSGAYQVKGRRVIFLSR